MTESERKHVGVVLEQILHEVKTVAEGHESLRNEIKASYKELDEKIELNASVMKFGFETLDAKIDGVRTELKEEIRGVRTELKEEIRGVDRRLTSEIRAVGMKVDGHEERISALERKAA